MPTRERNSPLRIARPPYCDAAKNAHLYGCERGDDGGVGLRLAGKDKVECVWDVCFGNCRAGFRCGPKRIAEFLDVAGYAIGCVKNTGNGFAGDGSSAGLETTNQEIGEVVVVNASDVEQRCGFVEWAAGIGEHRAHFIADAAEEDIWRFGLKLNLAAHCRQDRVGVFDSENVLKFVEDNAELFLAGMKGDHVEDVLQRVWGGRRSNVHGKRRRARVRVDGQRWAQPREQFRCLLEKRLPFVELYDRCRDFATEIDGGLDTEEIDVQKFYASGFAYGFADEGGLPYSSFTLDDDILTGQDKALQFAFQIWTRTEEVSINDATVSEGVHGFVLSEIAPSSITLLSIICNGEQIK